MSHAHFHFFCKPKQGQQIETTLTLEQDRSAVIHGVVRDFEGEPVGRALALLFCAEEKTDIPMARAHTDPEGHFAFWGLRGDRLYQVKLFQQNTEIRTLSVDSL